jgi:hypothetical protein
MIMVRTVRGPALGEKPGASLRTMAICGLRRISKCALHPTSRPDATLAA